MKCPKCNLVTFDHLAKCPRCGTSFHLQRRFSRALRDPQRRIVLAGTADAGASSQGGSEPAPARRVTRARTAVPRVSTPSEAPPPAVEVAREEVAAKPATREIAAPPFAADGEMAGEGVGATADGLDGTQPPTVGDPTAVAPAEVEAVDVRPSVPEGRPGRRPIFGAAAAPETVEEPRAEVPAAPEEEPPLDPHAADAARIKRQMVKSSQERRRGGPDLVSEVVDPDLPDWYSPPAAASRGGRREN